MFVARKAGLLRDPVWPPNHYLTITDYYIHWPELFPRAGSGDALATLYFIDGAVRCTDNLAAIPGQKAVWPPVEWMTGVHAEILIRVHLIALPHNETLERPVALSGAKFLTARVINLIQTANDHFLKSCVGQAARSVFIWRTTNIERMIDGMPSAAA